MEAALGGESSEPVQPLGESNDAESEPESEDGEGGPCALEVTERSRYVSIASDRRTFKYVGRANHALAVGAARAREPPAGPEFRVLDIE